MSFFAHLGSASGSVAYTSRPFVPVTGILDQIIADLSASTASGTNNGWSLWDDMRPSTGYTGSVPLYPRVSISQGIWADPASNGQNYIWTFTSGSNLTWGYQTYGYNYAYAISGMSGSPTPISLDQVTWYNAYYSSWPGNNFVTATLDRPYAGATTWTAWVYRQVTQWAVLKCTSAQRTFYLLIGCAQEAAGGPTLWMRPYEYWDNVNHNGNNQIPGSIEETTIHWAGVMDPSGSLALARMMVWFLPDAFALWTGNTYPWGPGFETLSYLGNLDTTGIRVDPDALAWIPGQMTYSGYNIKGGGNWNQGLTGVGYALFGVQCLRTLYGEPWTNPNGKLGNRWSRNSYQLTPRTRWYGHVTSNSTLDYAQRFFATKLDLYHVNDSWNTYASYGAPSEGRRGTLRHVLCPVNNPSNMFGNTITMDDGNTYIFVRQGSPMYNGSNANLGWFNFDHIGQDACDKQVMSGWTFSGKNFGSAGAAAYLGEISYGVNVADAGGVGYMNYLLLPINV